MYYRPYLPNAATIAKPLYDLTKTGHAKKKRDKTPVEWTDKCQAAFDKLIQMLCSQPLLAHPRFDLKNAEGLPVFWMSCDASLEGCGVVLFQIYEDNLEHVIAYASKTLITAERNYSVTDRELLAIVFGFRKFEHYLLGSMTHVVTDHSAAVAMLDYRKHLNNLKGRSARWAVMLQTFHFKVHYRKGAKHGNADMLSRAPVVQEDGPTETPMVDGTELELANLDIFVIDHQYAAGDNQIQNLEGSRLPLAIIRQGQQDDPYCQEIKNFLTHGILPDDPVRAKFIEPAAHRHLIEDGVLYRTSRQHGPGTRPHNYQVVVPAKLAPEVISRLHGTALSGHFGTAKVLATAERFYFWPKMHQEIHDYIQKCPYCQTFQDRGTRRELLQPIPPPNHPNSMWGMDHVGPLPESNSGKRYLLVFIDYFTKWPEVVAVKDTKAVTTAEAFVKAIVCRHGIPEVLLSDQGPGFIAELNKELARILGVDRRFSTPHHPQTNGLVENFNRTLIQLLRNYVETNHRDWDEWLDFALFAYRTSSHRSTGVTPFSLQYGFEARTPASILLEQPPNKSFKFGSNERIMSRMRESFRLAHEALEKEQSRQKRQYDQKAKPTELRVGDLVLRVNDYLMKGQSKKFAPRYRGPYRVASIDYPNVELQHLDASKKRTLTVHLQRVKKFIGHPRLMDHVNQGRLPELNRCGDCGVRYTKGDKSSWVGCDGCLSWYHFRCQDLTEEPQRLLWYCRACTQCNRDLEPTD